MNGEDLVRTGVVTEVNREYGIKVIFDGEEMPRDKYFQCNSALQYFAVNDRVKIAWVGGTWLVEYPIGKPKVNTGGTYPWM